MESKPSQVGFSSARALYIFDAHYRLLLGHKHQFDVIAFATGFDITSSLALDVTGVNGQRLQEYYDREGGPTGYMGTTIPGFPNWFTILGPNTGTGRSIFTIDWQPIIISS